MNRSGPWPLPVALVLAEVGREQIVISVLPSNAARRLTGRMLVFTTFRAVSCQRTESRQACG